MIALNGLNLSIRKDGTHKWQILEEMLSYWVAITTGQRKDLSKKFDEARLRIADASASAKLQNYFALIKGESFKNANKRGENLISEDKVNPDFKSILSDVYCNKWSLYDVSKGYPQIFDNHPIKLFWTPETHGTCFYHLYKDDFTLDYFQNKLKQYLLNIFKHVTPQHYIEHANAIGLLDYIIFVSRDEAKYFEPELIQLKSGIYVGGVNDYLGMFVRNAHKYTNWFNDNFNCKEKLNGKTIIFLCLENMEEFREDLKKNSHITLEEMLDKVFAHEVGHLAFAFYLRKYMNDFAGSDVAEKQANYICSISHDGAMDDLIEEMTSMQPPMYRDPVLLKHKRDNPSFYDCWLDELYRR